MSTETQARAEAALPELQAVTSVVLPEPAGEVVPLERADTPVAEAIRQRMDEIDLKDTTSIVHFGSRAQAGLQEISQAMLADVKSVTEKAVAAGKQGMDLGVAAQQRVAELVAKRVQANIDEFKALAA